MSEKLRFQILNWNEMIRLSIQLSKNIQKAYSPNIVIGVLRGGAVVSRIVSDFLGKELYTIGVKSYKGIEEKGTVSISQGIKTQLHGQKPIIIDDIVDTGETLSVVEEYIQEKGVKAHKTAVIHRKPWAKVRPHFWLKETEKWVVYPWEYYEFQRLAQNKLNSNTTGGTERKRLKSAIRQVQEYLQKLGDDLQFSPHIRSK